VLFIQQKTPLAQRGHLTDNSCHYLLCIHNKSEVQNAVSQCSAEAYAVTAELVASDGRFDPDYKQITCPAVFVAGDTEI
jgi:hypothetical protein